MATRRGRKEGERREQGTSMDCAFVCTSQRITLAMQMDDERPRRGERPRPPLARLRTQAEREAQSAQPNHTSAATHHQPTTAAVCAHAGSPHSLCSSDARRPTRPAAAPAHSLSARPPLPVGPLRTGASACVTPFLLLVRPPASIPSSSWWWRCD